MYARFAVVSSSFLTVSTISRFGSERGVFN